MVGSPATDMLFIVYVFIGGTYNRHGEAKSLCLHVRKTHPCLEPEGYVAKKLPAVLPDIHQDTYLVIGYVPNQPGLPGLYLTSQACT